MKRLVSPLDFIVALLISCVLTSMQSSDLQLPSTSPKKAAAHLLGANTDNRDVLALVEHFLTDCRRKSFSKKMDRKKSSPPLLLSFSLGSKEIESDLDLSKAKAKFEAKEYEQAISLYRAAIAKGGNLEKAWNSLYMLGECYQALGQWDQALVWYLEAFQANPSQGEPLKRISTYYRYLGWNDVSYLFAKFGSELPPSPTSSLNHYDFDEDLSIVAYYTQFKDDGFQIASDLVLKKNIPQHLRDQTYRNLLFYIEPLLSVSYIPIEIDLPLLNQELSWKPMNPSIRRTEEGFEAICRCVNYAQKGAREFHSFDEWGYFRSRNYLLQYDSDFNLLSQHEIIENAPREKMGQPMVQGLEDCRLFELGDASWFSCTTTDTNPTGSFQISLCKLEEGIARYRFVNELIPLKGPDPYRCEKNWLPFIKDQKLHFVYSYDPFILYRPDMETGECNLVLHYEPKWDLTSFRGSAGPIPFEGGYLILEHEVAFNDSGRNYLHRFLYLDSQFQIQKISRPFVFRHFGVEFCCSMCWDHAENNLILAIGIEDCEAYFGLMSKETLRSLLLTRQEPK